MRTRILSLLLCLVFLSLLGTACLSLGPEPTPAIPTLAVPDQVLPTEKPPTEETLIQDAPVDSVDIIILESFPVQVNALVRGVLPDGCTQLGRVDVQREGNTFRIRILTTRPADAVCTQQVIPFEQSVALDVNELPAGEYAVDVNGRSTAFKLEVDNVLVDFQVGGRVWHDLCAVNNGEGGSVTPGAGCVSDGASWYRANGLSEAQEPGLAGVIVDLGAGPCPAAGLGQATTDAQGNYAFQLSGPGEYCVSINETSAANAQILIPGAWTQPAGASAQTVAVDAAAASRLDVNFGWDFQFLPEPENAGTCTNIAKFVADVTVEDGTVIQAGQVFEKTWRIRNTGTCTWSPGYAFVFTSGDQMGGVSPLQLTAPVAPDTTADITIKMTAPANTGEYEGDWRMRDAKGQDFEVGKNASESFWVKIVVTEAEAGLNLGTPDWRDKMDTSQYWYLVNTANTLFEAKGGELVLHANTPGSPEEWGLATVDVVDFYMEGTFRTGDACSGLDRYGFIFRAPDGTAGYVFNISCNGQYRLYTWDGTNFNPLQNWKRSEAILSGPGQTNKIGVMADGNTIKLYANGKQLFEIMDTKFEDDGSFGLLVGSTDTVDFKVYVEEVAYWILD